MPSARTTARYFLLLPLTVLMSCTVGPDFQKPEVELPKTFSHQGMSWKRQAPQDLPKSGEWWKVYQDSALSTLVEQSLAYNQTIESASARLEQARAVSKATRSYYFPAVDISYGARRSKSVFRGPTGGSILYNSFTVPLDFSYEVDVWGKVRRQVEGAKATEAATEETLRALKLSIAGDVAQTYWALRAVDADRALLSRTLDIRRKALGLITRQQEAGAISGLDLSRAQTEVASAESDRMQLDQQRAELVNALAVLTGRMATGMSLQENASLPSPPSIPVSLPSEVLFQRPDVRAALHRVAAANAEIGVATAAMYPSFSIEASTGFDAKLMGDLLTADHMVWSLGSNILMPLSSQKFLRSRREATRANHRAVTADYRQAMIESVGEVENALQAAAILQRRQQAQAEAVAAAEITYERSFKRFEAGMVSFLDAVEAERTYLATQRSANAIRAESLAVSVSLIKSIGGEW